MQRKGDAGLGEADERVASERASVFSGRRGSDDRGVCRSEITLGVASRVVDR